MAVSQSTVWEIRPTVGLDTNGGGFVTGATGTDYSQQDSKNTVTADISTTDAVGVGTTTLTSATAVFGTTIVGNIIYLQGGTGSLAAGWYQVISRTNATTIVLDRSVAAGTGITMNIGGALATLAVAETNGAIQNTRYVKATGTLTVTVVMASVSVNSAPAPISTIGYTTTRTDGGKFTWTTSTNTTKLFTMNGSKGYYFQNITFTNTAGTRAQAIAGVSNPSYGLGVQNCSFDGFSVAIDSTSNEIAQVYLQNCTVKNSTVNGIVAGGATAVIGCYVHDNTGDGINIFLQGADNGLAGPVTLIDSVFYNNTGNGAKSANDHPYGSQTCYFMAINSAFVNNGAVGLIMTGSVQSNQLLVWNCIFYGNTTYGLSAANAVQSLQLNNNNAYGANGTAARLNIAAGPGDVTLSGDPFTNRTGGDFTLNNTAGAGASCRAAGYQSNLIG